MSDPRPTGPQAQPPVGGDRRRLDRAPGDRYRDGAGGSGSGGSGAGSGGSGSGSGGSGSGSGAGGAASGRRAGTGPGSGGGTRRTKALVAAAVVADAGAFLFFLLGLLDLGIGLLAVAGFTGWATALALVWWGRDAIAIARTRVAIGAFLGGWSVAGGILLDWVYALLQGGVLGPLDYVAQRYGVVALLALVVGTGVAALRAR